jgi:threonine/homoserine/homoserine lactone efflux protein
MTVAGVPLLAFLGAVLLISASPGPAIALILRRASLRGFRSAVATVAGLELGIYLWALAAAAGFAALVAASETAYVVLRVVGAGVLLWLGLRAWRAARRHGDAGPESRGPGVWEGRGASGVPGAFGEGLLVQLANPKAAVFMIAFYPQFVPADHPLFATTAVLAVLQVAVEMTFYLLLAAMFARAGQVLTRPAVRRRLEAASGTVLVALGVRVAVDNGV